MGKNKNIIQISISIALVIVILLSGSIVTRTYGQNSPQADITPQAIENEPSQDQPESVAVTLAPMLQYQGRLTNPATGKPVGDGVRVMSFSLYNVASGGAALWTETKNVTVTDGFFSTALGDTTVLSQNLFNGQALWLGVTVGGDPEAVPRQPVLPVAYAMSLLPGAVITTTSTTPSISGSSAGNGANFSTSSTAAGKSGVYGGAGSPAVIIPSQESGVQGNAADGFGVSGVSTNLYGVYGASSNSYGGYFSGGSGNAIYAAGSITATGNVVGQYTSLPLAYAHINSNGSKASGSANVASTWNANHYEITITGETYFYTSYVTTVTLGYGCGAGNTVQVTSGGGKLWVFVFNTAGSNVQCEFQFVSFKPW